MLHIHFIILIDKHGADYILGSNQINFIILGQVSEDAFEYNQIVCNSEKNEKKVIVSKRNKECKAILGSFIVLAMAPILELTTGIICRLNAWACWAVARGSHEHRGHANLFMLCTACFLMFKH